MVIAVPCGYLTLPKGISIQLKKKLDQPNKTSLPEGYQFVTSERKQRQHICKNKSGKHSRLGMQAVCGRHNKEINNRNLKKNQGTG